MPILAKIVVIFGLNVFYLQNYSVVEGSFNLFLSNCWPMYHALIRTHHITSRKKVAILKAAVKQLQCYALIRSGDSPGIMYVQANSRNQVQSWVETVRNLRYKDYQLACPVGVTFEGFEASSYGTLEEVSSVRDMADKMEECGLTKWWRRAMGFTTE
jgi:hypothetical protein